jgi:predicted nucleotidyltransferase
MYAARVTDLIEKVRAFFREDSRGAIAAYVFGSVARRTAREDSDVDVAVLYGESRGKRLEDQPFALADDLRGVLGRDVDVVVLDDSPPDLAQRVLRDGVVVLDRDRAARVRFEVQARKEFWDLKPYLDLYRRWPAR